MSTLQMKLETLSASFSAEERALVETAGADARPEDFSPELRAKLQGVADQLSPAEREAVREALADDQDIDGFMINQPRVKQPGSGGEPPHSGGGFDPFGRAAGGISRGAKHFWGGVSNFFPTP